MDERTKAIATEALRVAQAEGNSSAVYEIQRWLNGGLFPTGDAALSVIKRVAGANTVGPDPNAPPGANNAPPSTPGTIYPNGNSPYDEQPPVPTEQYAKEKVPTTPTPTPTPQPGPAPLPFQKNSASDPYYQAGFGDQTALNAVLDAVLLSLGIDTTHPGLFTQGIAQTIEPYLPLYLATYALKGGDIRGRVDEFTRMMSQPGSFGKIQDWANMNEADIVQAIKDQTDQGRASDMLQAWAIAKSAGNSPLRQGVDMQLLKNLQTYYNRAQTDNPQLHYLDFLNQNRDKIPMGESLYGVLR